ncbi:putative hAT dimerization domain, ribonuclease H-like superfamily protein [Tanacetum coccineum]
MRGLCANGIPFNVLRNPQFQEMVVAINKAPAGYKAPSSEKARTVLLDECARDVEKDLVPVKDTWYTQGVSIVSDGWSNVKHKPLINILAVNSRGATFMYAEDFSGVEKTGVEISKFLLEAIESIGPSNVLQVVTDNAANCKAAGEEVEKVHKHIFWSPCVVHTLNLIFKDLAKEFVWLSDTYKRGKMIVKYFLNHAQALSIFRENSKLELLKVAKTRFASHYILLKRLKECREALATTIVLNSWRDWAKKGDEKTRKIGQVVCETIRSDEFWDDVDRILAITKPIYLLIKFYDGEGAKMGEVYERMDNMVGEIKDVMKNVYNSYFPEVQKIVLARWEKMTIPLHCLGFALTPRFYDKTYLSTKAPGGIPRKPPNLDN